MTKEEHDNLVLRDEIERLKKVNNDLKLVYRNTYKRLFENGNTELAEYFQAQIDECPTFYIAPPIDYYKETKRLENAIKELEAWLRDNYYGRGQCKIDTNVIGIVDVLNKIKELKEKGKEIGVS